MGLRDDMKALGQTFADLGRSYAEQATEGHSSIESAADALAERLSGIGASAAETTEAYIAFRAVVPAIEDDAGNPFAHLGAAA